MSPFAQRGPQRGTQGRLARGGIEQLGQHVRGHVTAMSVQQPEPLGLQAGRMQAAQQQGQDGLRTGRTGTQRVGRGGGDRRRCGQVGRDEAAALPQIEGAERQPQRRFRHRRGIVRQQRIERRGEASGWAAGAGHPDL